MDLRNDLCRPHDDNAAGVQLAVTQLRPDTQVEPRDPDALVFSEAIVTGPAAMLERLGDSRLPASCANLAGIQRDTGKIEPLRVPRLGEQSWAYRITSSRRDIPIWQWVEVIQTSRYVLEIRIPNQQPAPRTDPAMLLPQIAREAYAKAESSLR